MFQPAKACKALPQLLRCFCNCSELTYDEFRTISQLSAGDLLKHAQGVRIFKAFLRLGTHTQRPIVYGHVEHAELCASVLAGSPTAPIAAATIDELFDRCLSVDWERRLEAAVDGPAEKLRDYCDELWSVLVWTIEEDRKWDDFHRELRRKLGVRDEASS